MFEVKQYNDDEGNRTIAVGEDETALMAEASRYHYDQWEETLVWTQDPNTGAWTTRYVDGMQYTVEPVRYLP